MNKQQFLKELQECLEGEVSRQAVYDNITYYDQYFEEQKAMGKSESQIAEEIGKPSLIAKTIVDAEDASEGVYYDEQVYTEEDDGSFEPETEFHMVEIKWYHKLVFVIVIIAIVLLLLTITGAILSFAAPIILILLIAYLIKRLFF